MAGKIALVVDDSATVREIVTDTLEEIGFKVEQAEDGEVGLQKALKLHPDLIILDLTMPKRDGIDVCTDLRENPDTKKTKIIMLTMRDSEFDMMVGKEVGADKYLPKPFDSETLVKVIRELIPE